VVGKAFAAQTEADVLPFVPELPSPAIYYGRRFEGREEADGWADSLRLCRIASETFGLSSTAL